MPRTKSLLFMNDGPEIGKYIRFGCCQFLHTSTANWGAVVLLKYMYNHKNIVYTYTRWLEFIQEKFQIDLSYKVVDTPIRGFFTLKHHKEALENFKNQYYVPSCGREKPFVGVDERIRYSDFRINDREIFISVYSNSMLDPKLKTGNSPIYQSTDKNIPAEIIPAAIIKFSNVSVPEYNSLKYIYWYITRLFSEHQVLANFMMDNEEKLEEIIKKHNLHWYNILGILVNSFQLSSIIPTGKIGKVDIDVIKEALVNYAPITAEYHEEVFDYTAHEVSVAPALRTYFEKDNIVAGCKTYYFSATIADTPHGKVSEKEATRLITIIENNLK